MFQFHKNLYQIANDIERKCLNSRKKQKYLAVKKQNVNVY